jgi:hypothetical protein
MKDRPLELLNKKTLLKKISSDISKVLNELIDEPIDNTSKNDIKNIINSFIDKHADAGYDIREHFNIVIDVDKDDPKKMVMVPQNFISALWLNGEYPNIDDILDKNIWYTKFYVYKWDDENKKMTITTTINMNDVFE